MKQENLLAAEKQVLAPAVRIQYFDIAIASGQGAILTDLEGKKYLDLLASASSTNTGHSHPHVVDAICQQSHKIIQYTPAYFANQPAALLAQRLVKLAPIRGPLRVAWGNSGSDANDAIIKYARAYTKRQYIVSFTGAYHGSTYGSISISSVSLNMSRKIGPLLPGIVKVPYPDISQKPASETLADFIERQWQAFKLPFETYLPAEEVAAIIMEPIQGDGGIIKAPKEYLRRVRQFATDNNILFAVDEVNQGFGRTGKWWSIQHFDVEPDLMTIGKSIASGLPLSAVIGRASVMDSLQAPANTYTTAGNPVTTAAANATLDVIEQEHLVEHSQMLGLEAEKFFQEQQKKYAFIGAIRFYGLNGGIDIVNPKTQAPDAEATNKLIYRLFELGILIISLRSYTLRFQPPLVITEGQLQQVFTKFEQAFKQLASGQLQLPPNADQIGW